MRIPLNVARYAVSVIAAVALAFPVLAQCVLAQEVVAQNVVAQDDPLPSWNAGVNKSAIIAFVRSVTDASSSNYVPPAERIATFDNDGTLWVEHPMYTQLAFALDRLKTLAPEHPEWKTAQPFKAALEGDMKTLGALGEEGLLKIVTETHAGMSTADFEKIVSGWIAEARHPRFDRPYTDLTYQPMVEVIHYLQENEFKTFIVSGGGIEFMRPWTARVYNIPPENVVGSSIKTEYKIINGKHELMRLGEISFIDDKAGKPVGINAHIGLRPIAAFGNSDGDAQMLQWTAEGPRPHLMMLVFHDDSAREYAYGPAGGLPDTAFGTFSPWLMEEAQKGGWHVISMKNDWSAIFSPP